MKVTRRGILKMLPATPFAVRQAQQEAEKRVGAGVNIPRNEYLGYGAPPRAEGMRGNALVNFLRRFGVPEWKKREMRRDSRSNRRLDPDVAALQSVSLSGKLSIQWRRNEKVANDKYYGNLIDDEERSEFLRRHGLDWL